VTKPLVLILVLGAATAGAAAAPNPFHGTTPIPIHGTGRWTFARLGAANGVVYTANPPRFAPTWLIDFDLPPGTHQGGRTWFMLHLHYRFDLSPRARPGTTAEIGAATDQVGCALIALKRLRGAALRVRMTTSELVHGIRATVRTSRRVSGWFTNYTAIAGIHGGRNQIQLMVGPGPQKLVSRVTFFADSYLQATTLAPAQFTLTATTSPSTLRLGRRFRLRIHLRESSNSSATQIAVVAQTLTKTVRLDSRPRFIAHLRPGVTVSLDFNGRALARGVAVIDVSAHAPNASAGTVLHRTVR